MENLPLYLFIYYKKYLKIKKVKQVFLNLILLLGNKKKIDWLIDWLWGISPGTPNKKKIKN